MIIDKIKVVYSLSSNFHDKYKNLDDYHKKNGCWFFIDFLERFKGSYTLEESLELRDSQMKKINSWQCYYRFHFPDEESSVSFFLNRLNAKQKLDGSVCQIEWNPNKATLPEVLKAFLHCREAKVQRVSSVDIAFDLKNVPIQNISFIGHGATSLMSIGTIGGTVTRYLRPKQKDGRIKVYNKEAERRGFPDQDKFKDITRVEITYQNVEFLLLNFLKDNGFTDYSADTSIDQMFLRDIDPLKSDLFLKAYDRISKMLKLIDSVRIYDPSAARPSDFGFQDWQADLFDAYIQYYGFSELNKLYNQMSKSTRAKFRAYADAVSNYKTRPLFAGCANDYFYALRSELIRVLPSSSVEESCIIKNLKWCDDSLPF